MGYGTAIVGLNYRAFLLAGAAVLFSTLAQAEHPSALVAAYFSVAENGDPDFHTTGCCVSTLNLVEPTLGPLGLPVLNPDHNPFGYAVHDLDKDGEIEWWTASPTVVLTGIEDIGLPIRNSRLFPPNGSGPNDFSGFQTAVFRGTLHLPRSEPVGFDVAVDDTALVYIDGRLVEEIGGVHPTFDRSVVTSPLSAGKHCLVVFYADLYPTNAELDFAITTQGVTATPT